MLVEKPPKKEATETFWHINRKEKQVQRPRTGIQRMWRMKTEVIPVVIIVGALGTVKKGMIENTKKVSETATVTETQKIYMLESARILRKVLRV